MSVPPIYKEAVYVQAPIKEVVFTKFHHVDEVARDRMFAVALNERRVVEGALSIPKRRITKEDIDSCVMPIPFFGFIAIICFAFGLIVPSTTPDAAEKRQTLFIAGGAFAGLCLCTTLACWAAHKQISRVERITLL